MAVDKDDSRVSSPANGANEGSEEESEYEIEAILDAKRGMFPNGRIGYFVKWKGYTAEDNSWVDEADAGNADELIKAFWSKQKSSKGKRGRKSTVALDEESDPGSASTGRKKGKKSQPTGSEEVEMMDARMSKKDEDEEVIVGDMTKHASLPSWEELIKTIDTIEKDESGHIMVYFTLKSGERIREAAAMCKKRCPHKLIEFYETHLKWREAEVEDVL
jgi:chromobox protein 5